MSTAKATQRSTVLVDLLSLTYFLVVFGLIWVPFGLKKTIPLYEEWYFIYVMDVAPLAAAGSATRPIFLWPYFVAHLLTPDSFIGMNLLLIAIFVLKAVVTYRLVRHLVPENSFLALMTATLGVIYPADSGLLSFRAISFHTALLLTIMAVYFFVVGWNKNKDEQKHYWRTIWVLQIIILGTYEALYPLIFVAPILLVWLEKKFTPQVRHAAQKWLVIPILYFVFTIGTIIFGVGGYINKQFASTEDKDRETLIKDYSASVEHMYRSHLDGWSAALKEWDWNSTYTWLALLTGLITFIISWVHLRRRREKAETLLQRGPLIGLILAGLCIMLLGFVTFIPSPFNQSTFRVFYATSLGAALIVSAIISLLARIKYIGKFSAALLASVSITMAISHSLNQHKIFADYSEDVGLLYATIIEQAPQFDANATLFVIDEHYRYQDEWHLASHSTAFQGGLRYLYGTTKIRAKICVINDPRHGKICEFREQGIYYLDDRLYHGVVPYNRAIIFRTTWNGSVELLNEVPPEYVDGRHIEDYDPHALIDNSPIPERTLTALSVCWPPSKCEHLTLQEPQDSFLFEFDRIINGFGWEFPNFDPTQLWMTNKIATIRTWLTADQDMPIQFKITITVDPDILDSLQLTVNGDPVELTYETRADGYYFTGIIPQSALLRDPTSTTLVFSVSHLAIPAEVGLGADERHLALLFDSLAIGYVCWPPSNCEDLNQNEPQDSFILGFDQAVNGFGWEIPSEDSTQLWMTSKIATIRTWLTAEQDLPIQFRVTMTLAPDALENLKLTVNGDPVELTYETRSDGYYFTGIIPQSALMRDPDTTILMFFVDRLMAPADIGLGTDERHLALLFDSLEIGAIGN